MNNKLISVFIMAIMVVSIFSIFATVVYAKGLNLLCSRKNIVVTLKNDADINKAKKVILEIPKIKIIKITYRDEEWSKMVNKMDLPRMENPFKNEFTVKTDKNANTDEIYNQIKSLTFVEDVKYVSNPKCKEK